MQKLTAAMRIAIHHLNAHGYVLGIGRTSTCLALMDRGILREMNGQERHYPASRRDAVHGEALIINVAMSGMADDATCDRMWRAMVDLDHADAVRENQRRFKF